jgi:nitroreductase
VGLDTLEAIRTRRVAKYYSDKPVSEENLWTILEAARWAPTAANRRIHRFVCVNDRELLRKIKMFSPGMVAGLPAALIIICIDWEEATLAGLANNPNEPYFDVGGAAENMLLAAHALGLAAGPMSAFSKEALQVLLNLPDNIDPKMFIGVGYPAEMPSYMPRWPKKKVRVEDLVQWGPYPD